MSDFIEMEKAANFSYQVLMGDAESIAQRLREAAARQQTKTAETVDK